MVYDDPNARWTLALTGLAALALLSLGHAPAASADDSDAAPEAHALRRALDLVLSDRWPDDEGYLGSRDESKMYGHGIVTLLLAESLGMAADDEQDARIRARLVAATELILRSQQVPKPEPYRGGWRYDPTTAQSDLSITAWQVIALRSAQSAGVEVPAAAIDLAVGFLEGSFVADPDGVGGRFNYTPAREGGWATTAAGMLALQVCGREDAPQVAAAAASLRSAEVDSRTQWFYYGTFYATTALARLGGADAALAHRRAAESLLPLQADDGSWHAPTENADRVYATSLALLALGVRRGFLPIYQR